MPRRLLILRHAKSSWDSGASTDFERPLAKRGKRDAPRMGHWLKKQHLKLGHVVSSPAERARQTTLEVCKVLGVKKKRISWDDRIYDGYTKQLLQVLADVPSKAETVMLVGHNPGLEDLLTYLWGENTVIPPDGKLLPTAAVAQVELPEQWKNLQRGVARLVTLMRPKDIL